MAASMQLKPLANSGVPGLPMINPITTPVSDNPISVISGP